MEQALQGLVDLGARSQRLCEVRCPEGGEHELLELELVLGVCATVDDVETGHREPEQALIWRKPAVERLAVCLGHCPCRCHGNPDSRVGPEPALVLCAVELDNRLVQFVEALPCTAGEELVDLAVDIADRFGDASPLETLGVAVAQLNSLTGPRRRSGGHTCVPVSARSELKRDFEGRAAPGVEDLEGVYVGNLVCHCGWCLSFWACQMGSCGPLLRAQRRTNTLAGRGPEEP